MRRPRSWPSTGTGRMGSSSLKPASGLHCLLCFVERGPALHWLECPSGGYCALDLVRTCEKYKGPETLADKEEEMESKAREEVLRFLENCDINNTPAGSKILKALMTDRNSGSGIGVDALSGGSAVQPRDVAKWIRDNNVHPVIWHVPSCTQKLRLTF